MSTAAPKGVWLAPQRLLSASSRSGRFVGALIVGVGVGFGVQALVAAAGQADVLVLAPNFDPAPVEGIKTQLDQAAAQVGWDLPELALHADGGIQADSPLYPRQEQSLPVGVWASGAQVNRPLGEAFGRGLPPRAL